MVMVKIVFCITTCLSILIHSAIIIEVQGVNSHLDQFRECNQQSHHHDNDFDLEVHSHKHKHREDGEEHEHDHDHSIIVQSDSKFLNHPLKIGNHANMVLCKYIPPEELVISSSHISEIFRPPIV